MDFHSILPGRQIIFIALGNRLHSLSGHMPDFRKTEPDQTANSRPKSGYGNSGASCKGLNNRYQ